MNAPKNLIGLGKRLFWVSVILSGIVGARIVRMLSYQILMAAPFLSDHWVLSLLALKMLAASLSFLVLYRLLALNLVAVVESKNGIEIGKPSLTRGVIYSALIPFILSILGLLIVFLLAGSGMHDSI
jgi:hypothetical protein